MEIRCSLTLALAIANTRSPKKPIVITDGDYKGEWRWRNSPMCGFYREKNEGNGKSASIMPPSKMYAIAGSCVMVFEGHTILPFK